MRWLWAAAGVALAANGLVLGGAARNRAGQPQFRLELTPGEYHVVRFGEDNSGVAIRMNIAPPRAFDRTHARPRIRVPGRSAFAALERRADRTGFEIVKTSTDPAVLRRSFPGNALMRAIIRPFGSEVLNPGVHVPLPYSRALLEPGRHAVVLCFGRSYEPWVCGVR